MSRTYKRWHGYLAACLCAWGTAASTANAAEIAVRLVEPPRAGTVIVAIFDSANAFGDLRDPIRVERFPLDGRDLYRIPDVPPGEYALLVYYDENDNGRLDRNFIGIPSEPMGFSNAYRPAGPPSYPRAAFRLADEQIREFEVELVRPLGRRGRISAGVGVLARSSPYRGYDGGVFQVIPALTYAGERIQLFGPRLQAGLAGGGPLRLAAVAEYRMGVYEEDESRVLAGMGDRKDTVMAGLALQAELPAGFDLAASYQHDLLDRVGGGAARIELDKSFQWGVLRLSPSIALNWLSAELANHDFGVPADRAADGRPAYRPGHALSAETGIGLFMEINRDWLLLLNVAVEALEQDVTDSPIVDEHYVVSWFAAISYMF